MNQFAELRTLLIGKEMAEIEALRTEIGDIAAKTTDPDVIVARLAPLIDKIVQRSIEQNREAIVQVLAPTIDRVMQCKVKQDREALISVLAPMIAEIIEHEIRTSGEKIAAALAPVIGRAMQVQIRDQKDEIVDALYPVIGTTVARYVSQAFKDLLETISTRVENTFSYDSIRRKMLSKVKGVPESELLLRENVGWRVEAVFLIHKPTGLLMAERYREETPFYESEMVASMLTAIRSFVNEWIAKQGEHAEINGIEYGDSTIYLEVAGYCYLAVVLKGNPSEKLTQTVTEALSSIVYDHGDPIKHFDGDRSALTTETLDAKLGTIIDSRPDTQAKKKTGSKTAAIGLGIMLLLLCTFMGYRWYQSILEHNLQTRVAHAIRSDAALALYRITVSVSDGKAVLEGGVPDLSLKQHAETVAQTVAPKAVVTNRLMVARPFSALEDEIKKQLERMQHRLVPPAGLRMYLFFDSGSSRLTMAQRSHLPQLRWLMDLYPTIYLKIEGYSDHIGTPQQRLTIATARADAVRKLLLSYGVSPKRMEAAGTVDYPPDFNRSIDDDSATRSVSVTLKKAKENDEQDH